MIRNDITPIAEGQRRMPEAGKIRIGKQVKTASGKMRPASISTFRFTSPYRDVIDQLAALYGGTVEAWNEKKATDANQWQVETATSDLDVYLPPGGFSQWYELWPGPARRCDGITVTTPNAVGEDYELVESPCICRARGERECTVYTRITVLIPQISFRGSWRLDTKSWNAKAEMPGVIDMIEALGGAGQTVQAVLSVRARQSLTPTGKKRQYVVPEISIKQTIHELQSGGANANRALTVSGTSAPALERGHDTPVEVQDSGIVNVDDDIVEAEVISDEELALRALLDSDARQFGLDPGRFVQALYGRVGASGALDDEQVARLTELHRKITAEEITPMGFKADGSIQWGK